MPKLKTNRSAKKRMRITKSGRVKYFRACKGHLLTGKRSKRKRHLGKAGYLGGADSKTMKLILPYRA